MDAAAPDRPVFEIRGVTQRFGTQRALSDVDLVVRRGERVALVGPSGAGKSTLIALLNGTRQPTRGTVSALGWDLAAVSAGRRRALQRRIGTIYQQLHLVDNLRVVHNVNAGHLGRWSLARAALSLLWPQATDGAAEALDAVGLRHKLYARTDTLSGGEQQRVALARVLVQDPVAVLADEPVSSLDPARAREIVALLCSLCAADGRTLVTSLHAVDLARRYCDRVVGLRAGRIAFDRPAALVTDAQIARLYRLNGAGGTGDEAAG